MRKYFLALLATTIPTLAIALMLSSHQAAAQNDSASFVKGEFPLVMYAIPATDKNFEQARSMGINYVHLYGLTTGPLTEEVFTKIQNYLDLAEKYQLKVMFDLDGVRRIPENQLAEMRTLVQRFKNHPALGFWYLFDEPDNKKLTAKNLMPFYKMIKAESPGLPIAICHAWTTHWYAFNDVQDILMQDTYPVTGAPFPEAKLDNQTKFTKGAMKVAQGKPVIPVLQFFNWQSMAKPEDKELRGYPVNELRYPNSEEMRYLCFSTIAQGSRGLGFYSYLRSNMTDPLWAKKTAAPVLLEVREFTNLVETKELPIRFPTAEEKQALLSLWRTETETYIILVNASSETRRMEHSIETTLSIAQLQAWGKTRSANASLKNGIIVVEQANPWEVFIWRIAH